VNQSPRLCTQRRRLIERAAVLLQIGSLAVICCGCRRDLPDGGPDIAYLTDEGAPTKRGLANLFPGTIGSRWSMSAMMMGKAVQIEVVVAGDKRIGANKGRLFETRMQDKVIQQEIYRLDKAGITRLASGERGDIVFDPPMPLLRYPVQGGDSYSWQGRVKSRSLDATGQMLCEVSGPEMVKTLAGSFDAYRLDIVTKVYAKDQVFRIPSTIWLAKNVGIVKQVIAQDGQRVSVELHSHHVK
jgi:hypothetical protein